MCRSISSMRSLTSCFDRACPRVDLKNPTSTKGNAIKTIGRTDSGSSVVPPSAADRMAAVAGTRCSIAPSLNTSTE